MKAYLHFMFSAFYLFKARGASDPKFFASTLSTFIITLLSLNVFFIVKAFVGLPNSFIIGTFLLSIFLEKIGDKFFDKAVTKKESEFNYLESKGNLNGLMVLMYFAAAIVLLIVTVSVTKRFW